MDTVDLTQIGVTPPDLFDCLSIRQLDPLLVCQFEPKVQKILDTFGIRSKVPLNPSIVFEAKNILKNENKELFKLLQQTSSKHHVFAMKVIYGELDDADYEHDLPPFVVNAILLLKYFTTLHSNLQTEYRGITGFKEEYYWVVVGDLTLKNKEFVRLCQYLVFHKVTPMETSPNRKAVTGPQCKDSSQDRGSIPLGRLGRQPKNVRQRITSSKYKIVGGTNFFDFDELQYTAIQAIMRFSSDLNETTMNTVIETIRSVETPAETNNIKTSIIEAGIKLIADLHIDCYLKAKLSQALCDALPPTESELPESGNNSSLQLHEVCDTDSSIIQNITCHNREKVLRDTPSHHFEHNTELSSIPSEEATEEDLLCLFHCLSCTSEKTDDESSQERNDLSQESSQESSQAPSQESSQAPSQESSQAPSQEFDNLSLHSNLSSLSLLSQMDVDILEDDLYRGLPIEKL